MAERALLGHAGGNLGLRVRRRRNPFFDERVPLVAVGTLPEQLRRPIPASHADVRVQVEHRLSRDVDVPSDQGARQIKGGERVPNCLVDGQRVRVVFQGREEEVERLGLLAL